MAEVPDMQIQDVNVIIRGSGADIPSILQKSQLMDVVAHLLLMCAYDLAHRRASRKTCCQSLLSHMGRWLDPV